MVYSMVVYKFHINIQSASKEDPSFGERGNSGEIPGRSGHCNQGGWLHLPLHLLLNVRREAGHGSVSQETCSVCIGLMLPMKASIQRLLWDMECLKIFD